MRVKSLAMATVAAVIVIAALGVVRATGTSAECEGALGSEVDLSAEPTYDANYLHRWHNSAGCPVRLDVLMLRAPGSDHHCAPWPPELVTGVPLGTSHAEGPARIYVRSADESWVDPRVTDEFSADAVLPQAAVDTGYHRDGQHLWVLPDDDSYIFLVSEDRTERWPLSAERGCA